QELTLAPHLTVEENITLGAEDSRYGFIQHRHDKVKEVLKLLGQEDLDPQTPVENLPIGTRQLIEIARAILNKARVVILDEPTSSLSIENTKALFRVIRKLRSQGIALVYISHFLEEIQQIGDRYTILRDGATVGSGLIEETSIPEIIKTMVGRPLNEMYPKIDHTIGEKVLSVKNLSGIPWPKDVSFSLHKGEIMGIFGLVGAGRSETMRCIFGLDKKISGEILFKGQTTGPHPSPKKSLSRGIDFLSEDRNKEGLAQKMSIAANTTLSALRKTSTKGFINLMEERLVSQKWRDFMKTKCHRVTDPVSSLSGGNQQKVAFSRILHHGSEIIILDEPTRGIDVGSKSEIYGHIQKMASEGKSLLVISSYLPELQGFCDSIGVMYRGVLSPVKKVSDWTEQDIMSFATTGMTSSENSIHSKQPD
ncbi:MAG: sugar ABC transporter ATP-binding protein, partial [Opitutaceae bacterium]|nr:sugar ABC transporter ATP-binding protein [Opitutaceae bacterium]